MTWQNKSKRIVPADWKSRKARVLTRHGRICGECGHGQADEVDHVLNVARGGTHDYDNLQPIHGKACPDCGRRCHVDKTKAEAQAARDVMWAKTKRPLPKHPGLL